MTNQSTTPQSKPDDEPQKSIAISESKEELEKLLIAVYQEFAGPIPPPSMMEQYEGTLPGSADRILKMAENQSEHRQWIEKKKLSFSNREVHLGQVLGFAIGVIAIITGGYTALNGAPISGGFIGTAGVVGLVSVFVIGSSRKPPQG
jgi:uncharacterized membrane protein